MAQNDDREHDVLMMFLMLLGFLVVAGALYCVITAGQIRNYRRAVQQEKDKLKLAAKLGEKIVAKRAEQGRVYPKERDARDPALLSFLEQEARNRSIDIDKADSKEVKHVGYTEKYILLNFKAVKLQPLTELLATVELKRSFLTVSEIDLYASRTEKDVWKAGVKLSTIVPTEE